MKFNYHWIDKDGIDHYTDNQQEADRALHEGYFIELIPQGTGKIAS